MAAAVVLGWPCAQAQDRSGMVVVRDPKTGEMRAPTADELRALRAGQGQAQAQTAPQTLQPTVRPDGTRSLKLGERGIVYTVVQRGADGKLVEHCVNNPAAAGQAGTATAPAQPAREQDHER